MKVGISSVPRLLLVLVFLMISLPLQAQEKRQKITIGSAQSIVPLARNFSTRFRKDYPGIEIEILGGGSNYAINAAREGKIDIGLISRSLSPIEKKDLHEEPFGRDAIFLLTYPGNPVMNLSLEQIRSIYLGKIKNWRDVGGEDQGIIPLNREKSSNIYLIFIQHVFGERLNSPEKSFTLRAGKGKILKTIKRIKGSLGYGILNFKQAEAQGIKVLAVGGKLPTAENVYQRLYPLTRPRLLISRGKPKGIVREWMLAFMRFTGREVPKKERR